jgi:hypothetical protein
MPQLTFQALKVGTLSMVWHTIYQPGKGPKAAPPAPIIIAGLILSLFLIYEDVNSL